jgi:hypothetical protein
MPSSTGETQQVQVPLAEGLHGILIRSKAGTLNVAQVIVQQ